ncbi:AlpA family phage regulatory protein [Vibrio parahaemolyticus]|uniref:helix-turn-helix transcriptional regulator n=1 Tax=Vibrio sp. 11-4(1) TaxID=2591018 RepID=UPI001482080F|nr:AlpA family phage regulatory protein [Vibrio sp. 11-4(1)]EJX5615336.1 AlpA family phage regulatory protein [Vibrio parahaemolyticus]EKQ5913319.1 AlpA family phage regulatory protein [Vibrio parahaemolyticus]NNN78792.1 AlpA family phage regulatory protein [Vibrio sp. 11-4(1)]
MKLIALIQVKNITGLGKTSIYQLMRDGKFPLNIKMGKRTSRWLESEVLQWIKRERTERLTLQSVIVNPHKEIMDKVFK